MLVLGQCRKDVLGKMYIGRVNTTKSGIPCQEWGSQSPHKHSVTPTRYKILYRNYCRNPDGESEGPWCYTMDKKKRFESCNIPFCQGNVSNWLTIFNGYVKFIKSDDFCLCLWSTLLALMQ